MNQTMTTNTDVTTYDPAVDRKLVEEPRHAAYGGGSRLVLKLGHEGNTPLYALDHFAWALAEGKPETWRPGKRNRNLISWSFGLLTEQPGDRLIVKPQYRWIVTPAEWTETPEPGWWDVKGYDLILHLFIAPYAHQPWGTIDGARQRVFFSPAQHLEDYYRVTAEVVETLATDRAAVLARARDACCFCHRVLTDPISTQTGYGPDCAKKFGLAHRLDLIKQVSA